MEYTNEETEVTELKSDNYKGYDYSIYSKGTFPCCKVIVDEDDVLYGKSHEELYHIRCHYNLNGSGETDDSKWFLSWTYDHITDRVGALREGWGKEWGVDELVTECENVIDQIVELNGGLDEDVVAEV